MSKWKLLNVLNSEAVVLSSGFMFGFINGIGFNKDTLHSPLSTLFNASVYGFFTYLGVGFVSVFLPQPLHFLIPTLTASSCVYHKYNDLRQVNKNE